MICGSNWHSVSHGSKSISKEPFYSQVAKDSSDSSGQSGSPSHSQLWETQVTWSWQRNSPGSHDCWSAKENVLKPRMNGQTMNGRAYDVYCISISTMSHTAQELSYSKHFLNFGRLDSIVDAHSLFWKELRILFVFMTAGFITSNMVHKCSSPWVREAMLHKNKS